MAGDLQDAHDAAAERLHAVGQRVTANRTAIVDALALAGRPLTIPEVLVAAPTLAQSSVYRNLAVLEQAGVVHRVVTTDEFARYELAEDLVGHHHHLVCTSCGAVEDFEAPAGLERGVASITAEVARTTGFRADHHRLDLVGRCRRCA